MSIGEIWTLAEASEGQVKTVSYELLARGRKLADKLGNALTSVLIGDQIRKEDLEELIERGADKVLLISDQNLASFNVGTYANVLEHLIKEFRPEIILAGATANGRTLMPYTAIRVKTGLTADCTELDIEPSTGNLLQTRPAIGGNILATIKTPQHRPQMATVRPKSTRPLPKDPKRSGEIVKIAFMEEWLDRRVKNLGIRKSEGTDVNIQDADIVVACGKGIKKADNLDSMKKLADSLKGVLACSREVVDRGWMSYPHQVGLSGKTVTPRLYVAIGISGAIQHLAGMKTAETIVAVNKDPDAPIFKVADFGIVGDLFEVLPALNQRLREEGLKQ